MRRYTGGMNGERFCANTATNKVHDLDNENGSCQINELINEGNAKPYTTRAAANRDGHLDCAWCAS